MKNIITIITLATIMCFSFIACDGDEEQPYLAPSFTTQPTDKTVDEGGSTSFSVVVSAGKKVVPTYEWFFYSNANEGWSKISYDNSGVIYSGETTATLTITDIQFINTGYMYQCLVSGYLVLCNNKNFT